MENEPELFLWEKVFATGQLQFIGVFNCFKFLFSKNSKFFQEMNLFYWKEMDIRSYKIDAIRQKEHRPKEKFRLGYFSLGIQINPSFCFLMNCGLESMTCLRRMGWIWWVVGICFQWKITYCWDWVSFLVILSYIWILLFFNPFCASIFESGRFVFPFFV